MMEEDCFVLRGETSKDEPALHIDWRFQVIDSRELQRLLSDLEGHALGVANRISHAKL